MTQEQQEQQIDLDPMAVYYRERLHNAMDENAVMRMQQQQYAKALTSMQEELKKLKEQVDAEVEAKDKAEGGES